MKFSALCVAFLFLTATSVITAKENVLLRGGHHGANDTEEQEQYLDQQQDLRELKGKKKSKSPLYGEQCEMIMDNDVLKPSKKNDYDEALAEPYCTSVVHLSSFFSKEVRRSNFLN